MHSYAPPRRRSSVGVVLGILFVVGLIFMGLIVVGAIFFLSATSAARSEAVHARAMVAQERAMRELERARTYQDQREHVLDAVPQAYEMPAAAAESAASTDGAAAAITYQSYPSNVNPYAPASAAAQEEHAEEPIRVANREITIELNQDGQVSMDGQLIELANLESALRSAISGRESAVSLVIKADKKCLFEPVAEVLSICKTVDIPSVRIAARD